MNDKNYEIESSQNAKIEDNEFSKKIMETKKFGKGK